MGKKYGTFCDSHTRILNHLKTHSEKIYPAHIIQLCEASTILILGLRRPLISADLKVAECFMVLLF